MYAFSASINNWCSNETLIQAMWITELGTYYLQFIQIAYWTSYVWYKSAWLSSQNKCFIYLVYTTTWLHADPITNVYQQQISRPLLIK